MRRDVVVVAPIIPSPPPRLDAPAAAAAAFLRRARHFAAVTALAGAPTVTLPLGRAACGAPVGLALFGQARGDQRLLAVASKLLPLAQVGPVGTLASTDGPQYRWGPLHVCICCVDQCKTHNTCCPAPFLMLYGQAELEKQLQPETAALDGPSTSAPATRAKPSPGKRAGGPGKAAARGGAAAPAAGGRAGARKAGGSGGGAAAAVAAPEPPDPKRLERAEKAKARGNELFKKGDYIEAVKAYTEALRHVADNPVYYSNRAMAYLKAFRCGEQHA